MTGRPKSLEKMVREEIARLEAIRDRAIEDLQPLYDWQQSGAVLRQLLEDEAQAAKQQDAPGDGEQEGERESVPPEPAREDGSPPERGEDSGAPKPAGQKGGSFHCLSCSVISSSYLGETVTECPDCGWKPDDPTPDHPALSEAPETALSRAADHVSNSYSTPRRDDLPDIPPGLDRRPKGQEASEQ